jgi:hypothetical protein
MGQREGPLEDVVNHPTNKDPFEGPPNPWQGRRVFIR